jgi:ribonuclease D
LYVETQKTLDEGIAIAKQSDFIAIDTEFIYERTYYPQLCLIQVASEGFEALIDPFAPLDLKSMTDLLVDDTIMKVFHAGSQDRIILYQTLGVPVRPVFDLQYAVLPLGLPQQMSLSALVRYYCNVSLKKEESFSDWARRPLTEQQLIYAYDDVRYLPDVYRKVVKELMDYGRLSWLEDDFKAMEEESNYLVDVSETWKRLKGATSLRPSQLALAQDMCAWREQTAQKYNMPKKWVLSDEFVIELCRRSPKTADDLFMIRGIKNHLNKKWVNEIIDTIAGAKEKPPVRWPTHEKLPRNDNGLVPKLDLLTTLLHLRAKELHITSSFLSNHDDLLRLASGQRKDLDILKGWRRELVGNELVQLLDGKLAISLNGDDLEVTLLSQAGANSAN